MTTTIDTTNLRFTTNAIVSDDYRDEFRHLVNDPIMQKMAVEIHGTLVHNHDAHGIIWNSEYVWREDSSPRTNLSMAAGNVYRERGGQHAWSIGGPAKALMALVEQYDRQLRTPKPDHDAAYEAWRERYDGLNYREDD